MIFMIKKNYLVFLTLFIASCNGITFDELLPSIRSNFISNDIEIDDEFINSRKFSFIRITVDNRVSVMSLNQILENDVFEWIGETDEKIYTFQGKIVKAVGTDFDFYIDNYESFSCEKGNTNEYHYMLLKPSKAYFVQSSTTEKFENKCVESFHSYKLRFKGKNQYQIKSDIVYKTTQKIHPNRSKVEVDFYYK